MYGNKVVFLTPKSLSSYSMLSLFFLAPIPLIVICTCASTGTLYGSEANRWPHCILTIHPLCPQVVVIFYRRKQKMLADQMDKRMEELELAIRKDIRQGQLEVDTSWVKKKVMTLDYWLLRGHGLKLS